MSAASMLQPGLCSVTFRQHPPEAVIAAAAGSGVAGIEWGADVHVPPGELALARSIARRCADVGIAVPSYGSYLRLSDDEPTDAYGQVLDTVVALGASNVRVWAGRDGPADAPRGAYGRMGEKLHLLCDQARERSVRVSLEFHRRTLTETTESALALIEAARHANLFIYWQPVPERGEDGWRTELAALSQHLSHLHVFHWLPGNERRPLAEGEGYWKKLVGRFAPAPAWRAPSFALLEFVAGNSLEQFHRDMEVLRRICESVTAATGGHASAAAEKR